MIEASQYQLVIEANNRLGILERILRVIRHRGGVVQSMQMETIEQCKLTLSITISTEKSITMLQSQLAKLVDIIAVECK